MSSTVQICLRHPGDPAAAMARIAVALDVPGYFASADEFAFTLRSDPWTTPDGVLSVDLSALDRELYGTGDDTAFAPYDFELSLELRNVPAQARQELLERAGRAVFDRLTGLNVPLAFGDGTDLFADFLPGRGVREFPPGVSWDEDARDTWFEPSLHGSRPAPSFDKERTSPARPSHGAVRVYETDGLLQIVPWGEAGPVTPVASVRAQAGPALLGRLLAEELERSTPPSPQKNDPWPWVSGTARLSPEEYARTAVSIDVRVAEGAVQAVPLGAADDALAERRPGPWDDEAAGELVLRLIGRLRAHAPT
ncbi:hypothetical protein D0T12_10680 [Actinomadura spongiicola]|uniref:Uncharacterized protein n=1 Tax=Actinomadura spongiicola TaxID=2303421 RepID=A0A372GK36_9ACTN|nr:hypothetical protein [Actinomadura spongiicola]RFS85489.1 hypothetical protein D0T12_10680 [Actinomadura spongiicola]